MLKQIIKIANKLDGLGLTKEADLLDRLIIKMSGMSDLPMDEKDEKELEEKDEEELEEKEPLPEQVSFEEGMIPMGARDVGAQVEYTFSKFLDTAEQPPMLRYDVHLAGQNIAYSAVIPRSTEGDGPWISGFYVKPEYRGRGLIRQLLAKIEQDFKGQVLRLRARPYKDKAVSQAQLIDLYQKLGFQPYDKEGRMFKQV